MKFRNLFKSFKEFENEVCFQLRNHFHLEYHDTLRVIKLSH